MNVHFQTKAVEREWEDAVKQNTREDQQRQ